MEIEITNQKKLNLFQSKIRKGEFDNLHLLADFDRTLTYGTTSEGEKSPSLIALLRNGGYLDEDYAKKAHALFDKYHPVEVDPDVSRQEKKEAMRKWWESHDRLLIEKGLSKQDFKDIIKESGVKFRKGVPDFLAFLNEHDIPVVIISASGTGEAVPMFFEKREVDFANIHFVVNRFEWDEKGVAVDYKKPVIHSMNKDETVLEEFPEIYKKVRKRREVILLGDSLGDIDMVEGFDYSQLLKIGFLCYNVEENREQYRKNFDVVLEGDGDFGFISDKLFGLDLLT